MRVAKGGREMAQYSKKALYLLMAVLFLAGCEKFFPKKPMKPLVRESQAPEVKGTLIARVNNQPITLEELNEEIESYNNAIELNPNLTPDYKSKAKIVTRDGKIAYLKDEMIHRQLLSQAASDRGLDRKEELQKALNSFKQNLLVAELVKMETENIEVTSAEIEDYYNQYKEQVKKMEERRIREIVVASESEAKDILIELLRGADFAALAQSRSIASSKDKGGDLGDLIPSSDLIAKYKSFSTFIEMAFSPNLEVGRTSNYFKGPDGYYYILKLEAKHEGKAKSLSELWDQIKDELKISKQQKKVADLISSLSAKSKIEVIESAVK